MAETKNYFEELFNVDVSDKIEKKNGLSYLSWAYAWGEIKKRHPQAQYKIYENADGYNYFTDGKTCWVKTGVTIDGLEHIEYLPVMNNRNKSIPLTDVTSFDVNTAIQRSLTKACARHGLGLYVYAGEDLPEEKQAEVNAIKFAKPTPEQIAELSSLDGDLPKVADYFKCDIAEVTAEQVQQLIDKKRKILAKKQQAEAKHND